VPKKTGANLSVRAGFRCASEYCPGKAVCINNPAGDALRPAVLCGRGCSAAGGALRPVPRRTAIIQDA